MYTSAPWNTTWLYPVSIPGEHPGPKCALFRLGMHLVICPLKGDQSDELSKPNSRSSMSLILKAATSTNIQHLHIFQLASFIASCQELLPVIEQGWRERGNSDTLPVNITTYLCRHLRMKVSDVETCWSLFEKEIRNSRAEDNTLRDLIAHTYSTYTSVIELRKLGLGECFGSRPNIDLSHLKLKQH